MAEAGRLDAPQPGGREPRAADDVLDRGEGVVDRTIPRHARLHIDDLVDLLVELMDVPRKAEFVERIRNALNIPKDPDEMNEEERAAAEQQAQQAQMQQELAMREMQAKLAELEGKAAKWQAEAQRIAKLTDSIRFEDALTQAQTGKTLQEMEQLAAQQQAMQTEQAALQAQLLDTIQQQIDAIAL